MSMKKCEGLVGSGQESQPQEGLGLRGAVAGTNIRWLTFPIRRRVSCL